MPTGRRPPMRSIVPRSASESRTTRSSPGRSRMRLRSCQLQSFQLSSRDVGEVARPEALGALADREGLWGGSWNVLCPEVGSFGSGLREVATNEGCRGGLPVGGCVAHDCSCSGHAPGRSAGSPFCAPSTSDKKRCQGVPVVLDVAFGFLEAFALALPRSRRQARRCSRAELPNGLPVWSATAVPGSRGAHRPRGGPNRWRDRRRSELPDPIRKRPAPGGGRVS